MEEFTPYIEPIDPADCIDFDTMPKKKERKIRNGVIGRERKHQIVIRMNDEELQAFRERIATTNLKQSTFIIKALLKRKIVIVEGAKELRDEINKVGVNLNQIAKHLNQGNPFTKQIAKDLEALEVALWQFAKTYQTKEPVMDHLEE